MISRAELLKATRRALPHGSWRRLGDIIDAAGQPTDVHVGDEFAETLAFGIVLDGYVRVEIPPGSPERILGPGDLFGFPGHLLSPLLEGEMMTVKSQSHHKAKYLKFTSRLLHAFHAVHPAGFPANLPGF